MILVLDALIALAIMIFLIKGCVVNYKSHKELSYLIGVFAFLYFVSIFLRIAWIGEIYSYSDSDLLTLTTLIVVAQAVICYLFVRIFKKNALTNVIFWLYIVSLVLIFISPLNFRLFAVILSFFSILLSFLNLLEYNNNSVKRIGYLGLIYSGVGVVLFFLYLFGINNIPFFVFLANLMFLTLAYYMSVEVKEPIKNVHLSHEDKSVFLIFMKYFIFILAFTNLVLIGTLGLHEFSHVLVARHYDCDARAIFFEKGIYPYSEISCTNVSGKDIIALAGPVIPILFAIILFFVESSIARAVAFLSIGFNLVAAYKDLKEIGISESIILVFTILGISLLILGVFYLARFILKRENRLQ